MSFVIGSTNKKIHMQLENHEEDNSALPVKILDGSFKFQKCIEKKIIVTHVISHLHK